MSLHAVTVGSVRLKEASAELGCDRLRGIGFAWKCRCGERGVIRGSYREARFDGTKHVLDAGVQAGPSDPSELV